MVRTRGGESSNMDRVRPTASVRRRRGGPRTLVPNEYFKYYIEREEVEIMDTFLMLILLIFFKLI